MRRQLGMLAMGTWLALAGVAVTASPAAATPGVCAPGERRNVGGTGPAACTCWMPFLERRNVGGTGPAACTCVGSLFERRNVGGTGPADGTCSPWPTFSWQFPRFRFG
ncbi:hypothetical protein [Blastococcus sp. CT_GayMR16]|uniref:hypothetical protein n=1 Tax=Blastococcus sp. CT_GayMR16 TaxID=2559607 RepID=UPI001074992C|nr:hypothetical protein [Blastococcus sp. CT_GayMR16]TFV87821.1 hypothetical protein E4P38_12675 [Blastococcus sp. CT_GayMR16]